jgi:hypothetical protein
MYLELFHGRNDPNEDMEDWGFEGPVIGPFTNAHITYNTHIKLWSKRLNKTFKVTFHGDMIEYDGKWFGDWAFLSSCSERIKDRKITLTQSKLELF